jgi:hypothetical protein
MAKKPVKNKVKPAPKAKKKKPTLKAKKKALDDFIDAIDNSNIDFDVDEGVWTFESDCGQLTFDSSLSSTVTGTAKDFAIDGLPGKYTITMPEGHSIDQDKLNSKPKFGKHSHECLMVHGEMIVDLKYYYSGNDQKVVGNIVPANGYKPGQMSIETIDSRDSQLVYKNHDRVVSMPLCDGYDMYLLLKYWFETADKGHIEETVYYERTE